ncbi:S46 family peptidase [Kangiella sediminilitoris]|uniref:Dipeptidyl-peptidase n=1 Tax=Kangiella sediminilitoris TaxID=1144748 RepID=A0A1B3BB65_9GAMM|nr:S46 family peptidase [Kangiella sediminilitoris]AOE50014.1 dipeptidyl-peptidase 7 [Kangiella sediminilitoris]
MKNIFLAGALSIATTASPLMANEGMWQPSQLPEIEDQLEDAGLEIDPDNLSKLTEFPMGAVISLGGCTASFLSPKGLVATNHHCAYGSIQFNSTAENNLLEKGFLADSFEEELPAAPGSRVYVTTELTNVTDAINDGLTSEMSGMERYKAVEKKEKSLVAGCEAEDGFRCNVYSFHGGLEYFLIKQMEIRDVRLVYAPSSHIGKYGGDIDNWMWPRHTGDFSFYRAYVGKDGMPADFSEDNVPYEPEHYLKVNANGVSKGDFVMVTGYPGRTNRYRTSAEVKNQFEWRYPTFRNVLHKYISIIEENAPEGSDARVKYASTLAGLNNAEKNWGSMIESYGKGDLLERRQQLEAELEAWLSDNPEMNEKHGDALAELDALIKENLKDQAVEMKKWGMNRDTLTATASRLYRLAIESEKPDAEREPGYQERDITRIKEGLKRMNRRWDATVEKALYKHFVAEYAGLPTEDRMQSYDTFMGIDSTFNVDKFNARVDWMFAETKLTDEQARLNWIGRSVDDFKQSQDPFIQLAVAVYDEKHQKELDDKEQSGKFKKLRPQYMAAIIDFYKSKNMPVYADANSTLRVTYGNVKGYSPEDGMFATPFTTLEGLAAKHTGEAPFNSPLEQLDLIKDKKYGDYEDPALNSVQVNFLSTVDTTGGNSGSPTMNAEAQFVGLLFDGVYESIIGDWDYNPDLNRSIHVSSAYMLWVMEHVDGARNLIEEMDVVR